MVQWSPVAELIVAALLVLFIIRIAEPFVTNAPSLFLVFLAAVMGSALLGVLGFRIACFVPIGMLALGFIIPARNTPKKGHHMCGICHFEWRSPNGETGYQTCQSCKRHYRYDRYDGDRSRGRDGIGS